MHQIAATIRAEAAFDAAELRADADRLETLVRDTDDAERRAAAFRLADDLRAQARRHDLRAARADAIAEAIVAEKPTALDLGDFDPSFAYPGGLTLAAVYGLGRCEVSDGLAALLTVAAEAAVLLEDRDAFALIASNTALVEALHAARVAGFGIATEIRRARKRAAEPEPTYRFDGEGLSASGACVTLSNGRRVSARVEGSEVVITAGNERIAVAVDHAAGDHVALQGLLLGLGLELRDFVAGPDHERLVAAVSAIGNAEAPVAIAARLAGGHSIDG